MPRLIRALGVTAEQCKSDVSTLIGTVLHLWCKTAFHGLPPCDLPKSKILAVEPKVIEFTTILSKLNFLESTYWLSSAYAMLIDKSCRKNLAMFFTPPSITEGLLNDLADQGVDFGRQSFVDPACGGAAFLAPIALRMRLSLLTRKFTASQILRHIEKNLYGYDIDETLCKLSRHFLFMALHAEIIKSGYRPSFKVVITNSLTNLVTKFGTIDVVVCNPPYRKMTSEELRPLRKHYSSVIEAQPNLYCLFISLCVNLLKVGGHAALVTPTSFLSGQYFGLLREFLISNTDIKHIGMVSDRQGIFIDVEQETALTVIRRRRQIARVETKAKVSVVSKAGLYASVGQCRLPSGGLVWPIPRSVDDVRMLKTVTASRFRFSDYGYRIKIGSYVWNRDKRPRFKSLLEVNQLGVLTAMPLLWSRDIMRGTVIDLDETAAHGNGYRFVDLGSKEHRSVVNSPCVVLQRVTSNDQMHRLVAATVSPRVFKTYGGFIGENHVVIVQAINDRPTISVAKLAELLSVEMIDRYFRCISGSTNVSVFELNQLALPDPAAVVAALSSGKSMEEAVKIGYGFLSE